MEKIKSGEAIDYNQCVIGCLDLRNLTIESKIKITYSIIDEIKAEKTNFLESIDFSGTLIKNVNFLGAEFQGFADFEDTHFGLLSKPERRALFNNARFYQSVRFTNAIFKIKPVFRATEDFEYRCISNL